MIVSLDSLTKAEGYWLESKRVRLQSRRNSPHRLCSEDRGGLLATDTPVLRKRHRLIAEGDVRTAPTSWASPGNFP
jgi:hypothetical protein